MKLHALEWRPLIMNPCEATDRDTLETLVRAADVLVHDTIDAQLDDLMAARKPDLSACERAAVRRHVLGRTPSWQLGRWVYYPWSSTLVHTLAPAEFREVRLAKNQPTISREEQARLSHCAVGIVGLSAGRHIAQTLATEGVCSHFRLADSNTLALSDMSCWPARIGDLGISTAVLVARELFEMDPFLDIEIVPHGLVIDDLDSFIGADCDPVDLVIEECADAAIKSSLRERLRARQIPVIMDFSKRGILDIERYDCGPEKTHLHGLCKAATASPWHDSQTARTWMIGRLPGMQPRPPEAVVGLGASPQARPQLASEIALGAATVTTAARRILLGEPISSGRYQLDMSACLDTILQ